MKWCLTFRSRFCHLYTDVRETLQRHISGLPGDVNVRVCVCVCPSVCLCVSVVQVKTNASYSPSPLSHHAAVAHGWPSHAHSILRADQSPNSEIQAGKPLFNVFCYDVAGDRTLHLPLSSALWAYSFSYSHVT